MNAGYGCFPAKNLLSDAMAPERRRATPTFVEKRSARTLTHRANCPQPLASRDCISGEAAPHLPIWPLLPTMTKGYTMCPSGRCYEEAYKHARQLTEGGEHCRVLLVHGSVIPRSGPCASTRITHAWVEADGNVYDLSNANNLVTSKKSFTMAFSAERNVAYTYDEAALQFVAHEHYGPWDDKSRAMGECEREGCVRVE